MKIVITDKTKKEIFAKLFKHLTTFSTIVSFRFNDSELYIQGMDSGHISLFELKLKKDWFDIYTLSKPIVIAIDIKLLSTILCFRDINHNIIIEIDDNGDTLYIALESEEDSKLLTKAFEIPIMDIDEVLLAIPEVEYPADFIMNAKELKILVDQMNTFGDILKIKCTEEFIQISSKGDNGKMNVKINLDDIDEYSIEEEKEIELEYSTKYILWMLEYSDIVEQTHVHISEDVPMQIYYSLDDGNYIRFYLAPRISDY